MSPVVTEDVLLFSSVVFASVAWLGSLWALVLAGARSGLSGGTDGSALVGESLPSFVVVSGDGDWGSTSGCCWADWVSAWADVSVCGGGGVSSAGRAVLVWAVVSVGGGGGVFISSANANPGLIVSMHATHPLTTMVSTLRARLNVDIHTLPS